MFYILEKLTGAYRFSIILIHEYLFFVCLQLIIVCRKFTFYLFKWVEKSIMLNTCDFMKNMFFINPIQDRGTEKAPLPVFPL